MATFGVSAARFAEERDRNAWARRERRADARKRMLAELDRVFADQRRRIQGRLQGMGHRIHAARHGGEYGDEIVVTQKRG